MNKNLPGIPLCPGGQGFESLCLAPPWEGDTAGEKHRRGGFIPGTVFMVAHQGESSAGKLHPDLMAASGMQTDEDERAFSFR